MLNINTKLLDMMPTIGTESFAILMLVSKRIGKTNRAFPSLFTLQKESGLSEEKVSKAVKILVNNSLLSKKQLFVNDQLKQKIPSLKAKKNGSFYCNEYTITTKLIGIFINCDGETVEEVAEINEPAVDDTAINDNLTNEPVINEPLNDETVKTVDKVLENNKVLIIDKVLENNKVKKIKFNAEKYVYDLFKTPEVQENYLAYLEIRKVNGFKTTQKIMDLHKLEMAKCKNKEEIIELITFFIKKQYQGFEYDWFVGSKTPKNQSNQSYISNR
jgi:hypothetical protein